MVRSSVRRVAVAIGVAASLLVGALIDPAYAAAVALPTGTIEAGDVNYQTFSNTVQPDGNIPAGFGLAEASEDDEGDGDAVDGAGLLSVAGSVFKDADNTVDITPNATFGPSGKLLSASGSAAKLKTSLKVALFGTTVGNPTDDTSRWIYTLKNTGTRARTVKVLLNTNYGSDTGTVVETTTSGDVFCDGGDTWCITSDDGATDDDVVFDAVVNTVFGDLSNIFEYKSFFLGGNFGGTEIFRVGREVKIKPGQKVSFMFFYHVDNGVGNSEVDGPAFNSLASLGAAGLLAGLSSGTTFANWSGTV